MGEKIKEAVEIQGIDHECGPSSCMFCLLHAMPTFSKTRADKLSVDIVYEVVSVSLRWSVRGPMPKFPDG